MYQCDICKKQFTTNQSLKYHINKGACKIECKCDICGSLLKTHGRLKMHIDKYHSNTLSSVSVELASVSQPLFNQIQNINSNNLPAKNNEKKIMCKYCNSVFKFKSSLCKHVKSRCKVKNQLTMNDNLSKDITLTENTTNNNSHDNTTNNTTNNNNSHNTTNNNTTNNNTTNNNSNNTTNNTTINFVLNKHGEENLSYITDSDYLKCFEKGLGSLEKYISIKHFNDEHPENANLYIDNIHSEYCNYYDGKKFIIVKIEDIIMQIIDDNLMELDYKNSELKEKI